MCKFNYVYATVNEPPEAVLCSTCYDSLVTGEKCTALGCSPSRGAGGQPLRCTSKTYARRFSALARMATSAAPGQRHCASFCRVQYSPHRAAVSISSACSLQPISVSSSKNSAVHLPMRSSLLFLMHFVLFVALENMHRRKGKILSATHLIHCCSDLLSSSGSLCCQVQK